MPTEGVISDMKFELEGYMEGSIREEVFELPTDSGDCEQSCGEESGCRADKSSFWSNFLF